MQQISWEVMKIYLLKIYDIRYRSFVLSFALSVSYVRFVKHAPGHDVHNIVIYNMNIM